MSSFDPSRRSFLTSLTQKPAAGLSPPWTVASEIVDKCSRCGDCITACAEGILVKGSGGFPELDFTRGACTFCGDCAESCDENLFDRSRPFGPRAHIASSCLAQINVDCQACADACGERAIRFQAVLRRPPQPVLTLAACTGCGACVAPCPVNAISLTIEAAA